MHVRLRSGQYSITPSLHHSSPLLCVQLCNAPSHNFLAELDRIVRASDERAACDERKPQLIADLLVLLEHVRVNELADGQVPHRWSDGALCLYGVSVAWNPGRDTILSTLTLGRSWLRHYDAWRRKGNWPKEGGESNE